jgi:hypothetical protein
VLGLPVASQAGQAGGGRGAVKVSGACVCLCDLKVVVGHGWRGIGSGGPPWHVHAWGDMRTLRLALLIADDSVGGRGIRAVYGG